MPAQLVPRKGTPWREPADRSAAAPAEGVAAVTTAARSPELGPELGPGRRPSPTHTSSVPHAHLLRPATGPGSEPRPGTDPEEPRNAEPGVPRKSRRVSERAAIWKGKPGGTAAGQDGGQDGGGFAPRAPLAALPPAAASP